MMLDRSAGSILVFGPAYLDRVVQVDRPLLDPALGMDPLDRSVDGSWRSSTTADDDLILVDPASHELRIEIPDEWPADPGAGSSCVISRRVFGSGVRHVQALSWDDDLGGMGAGFARSLNATLVSALGPADEETSQVVEALIQRYAIAHEPVRVAGQLADWTLLISSGPHGDKLPIGFRGCHAAWTDFRLWHDRPCRVRIVAALPNRVIPQAFGAVGASQTRAFFPAARNVLDRTDFMAGFADQVDFLSCNQGEWDDLGEQAAAMDRVPLVAVTAGSRGASVRFVNPEGVRDWVTVPAFPRRGPIVDTNRAGETFAAALLATLVEAGWTAGPVAADLVRYAATRGAAAAALVLGRTRFGFPTAEEINRAVAVGWVD